MFKVKIASALVILFAAVISPLVAWGSATPGSAGTEITLNATVEDVAEWDALTHIIAAGDWGAGTGHINSVTVAKTVSKTYQLYMNAGVTITPTGTLNDGILTIPTTAYVLKTEYTLTGGVGYLLTPDDGTTYKLAGAGTGFFAGTNTYTLAHTAGKGSYDVILGAKMSSPTTTAAPEVGNYTCKVTLTAAWL